MFFSVAGVRPLGRNPAGRPPRWPATWGWAPMPLATAALGSTSARPHGPKPARARPPRGPVPGNYLSTACPARPTTRPPAWLGPRWPPLTRGLGTPPRVWRYSGGYTGPPLHRPRPYGHRPTAGRPGPRGRAGSTRRAWASGARGTRAPPARRPCCMEGGPRGQRMRPQPRRAAP